MSKKLCNCSQYSIEKESTYQVCILQYLISLSPWFTTYVYVPMHFGLNLYLKVFISIIVKGKLSTIYIDRQDKVNLTISVSAVTRKNPSEWKKNKKQNHSFPPSLVIACHVQCLTLVGIICKSLLLFTNSFQKGYVQKYLLHITSIPQFTCLEFVKMNNYILKLAWNNHPAF